MYLYLYDYGLDAPRYRRPLARLETRLSDLGISGKISRLSPLKNLRELLRDEVASGVTTIVAVGNDTTVLQVITEILNLPPVSLGIIPFGAGPHEVATALGIPEGEAAADTVAARVLLPLDVGRANGFPFVSWLTVPSSRVRLAVDGRRFELAPTVGSYSVTLCNLRPLNYTGSAAPTSFNPHDGILEAYIQPTGGSGLFGRFGKRPASNSTLLPFRTLTLLGDSSIQIITDGARVLKPPVEVEVLPGKLRVIVGRKRLS